MSRRNNKGGKPPKNIQTRAARDTAKVTDLSTLPLYDQARVFASLGKDESDLSEKQRITSHMIRLAVDRTVASIERWQACLQIAEDVYLPNRASLMDLYYSLRKDGHIKMLRKVLYGWVNSGKFQIINEADKSVDMDATKLFKGKWFKDLREHYVDHIFEGFRLIQFDEINAKTGTIRFDLVDPKHVRPERGEWTVWQFDISGTPYRTDPNAMAWMLEIGRPMWLGELDSCAPYIIFKRGAMQAQGGYIDAFGLPIMKGKTNATDKAAVKRMSTFFENMNGRNWMTIDHAEEVDVMFPSGSDASQIYTSQEDFCNAEMSKMILLNVMGNDIGKNGSRAQSQTHQQATNDPKESLREEIVAFVNEQVFKLLELHGFDFKGKTAHYAREVKVSRDEVATDQWLFDTFESGEEGIEYIKEKYDFPAKGYKPKMAGAPKPVLMPSEESEDDPNEDAELKKVTEKAITDRIDKLSILALHAEIRNLYEHKHEH